MKKTCAVLVAFLLLISMTVVAEYEFPENATDLFKEIYFPYAAREKPFLYTLVVKHIEESGFPYEFIGEDSNIILVYENEEENCDRVSFWFIPGDAYLLINSLSYHMAENNCEASLSNMSSDGSPQYDKFAVRVVGEVDQKAEGIEDQIAYLFE